MYAYESYKLQNYSIYSSNKGTVNDLKILTLFSFCSLTNKILGIKAGNHKTYVRIANRADPDQNNSSSDLVLPYLSKGIFCKQLVFKIIVSIIVYM